jgi:citrate lyase subunit beta/citryl-CoA lyase
MTARAIPRSILYTPALSLDRVVKAWSYDADVHLIDLEDAVPARAKTDETRRAAARALAEADWRAPTVAVRINGPATEWWERDLELVVEGAAEQLDCIVVPKVESADDVERVERKLGELGDGRIGLDVQIESARGLVEVERIAAASARLEALVFGPGDYAASLGLAPRSIGAIDPEYPGDQWHYARSRIAAAAHAFGLDPVDGPYADVADLEGLRESARRARLLGFTGKWVIHPAQVEVVHQVFSPTSEEVEHARAVLAALPDGGVATLDGTMVDEASRRLAEAVLARAGAAAAAAT